VTTGSPLEVLPYPATLDRGERCRYTARYACRLPAGFVHPTANLAVRLVQLPRRAEIPIEPMSQFVVAKSEWILSPPRVVAAHQPRTEHRYSRHSRETQSSSNLVPFRWNAHTPKLRSLSLSELSGLEQVTVDNRPPHNLFSNSRYQLDYSIFRSTGHLHFSASEQTARISYAPSMAHRLSPLSDHRHGRPRHCSRTCIVVLPTIPRSRGFTQSVRSSVRKPAAPNRDHAHLAEALHR